MRTYLQYSEVVWRILKTNKFHPYHATLTQNLNERDYEHRLKFYLWALYLRQDPSFFSKVLFTDYI